MATLYIEEYIFVAGPPGSPEQLALEPVLAAYSMAITAGSTTPSAPNAAFNPLTNYVMLHCDSVCSIAIGKNPTAVTTARRRPVDHFAYYAISAGQNYTVAVIANT